MNKKMILVFDVETTGLLPRLGYNQREEFRLETLPYITQLSFVLYDIIQQKIIKSYDAYIKIPSHVQISEKITELTGVNRELLENIGKPIEDVLKELYLAYCHCDVVVAHNLEFDSRMVNIEIKRNFDRIEHSVRHYLSKMFDYHFCKITLVSLHCTMKTNTEMCNIQRISPTGKPYTKFPNLCELHQYLFSSSSIPANLHNSMIDVYVCLRCFLKKEYNIFINDHFFQNLVGE